MRYKLNKLVDEKLVSVQKHPTEELFIYNYSPRVQYDRLWDETTRQARGLILNGEGEIVARPFPKFFNLDEPQTENVPDLPFEVSEKMDGSLGILYWVKDEPFIATRGSFTSEQALHATKILYDKYPHTFSLFEKGKTYLFEIIYPENRIVLDYKGMDDLILIAVIDNSTGLDCPLPQIGFPVVKKFSGVNDIESLRAIQEDNKEGFVLLFKNGFRVKMKFTEYVRLHRILTGFSNVTVWEYLSEGRSMDELLERVPDEFYSWVRGVESDLKFQYLSIMEEAQSAFKILDTRKETALYFQTQKYPHILYRMLDNRSPDDIIWKMIRPKFLKPFKEDNIG